MTRRVVVRGLLLRAAIAGSAALLALGVLEAAPAASAAVQPGPGSVAVGENFACAITSTATVKCWGFNQSGQLGNGSLVNAVVKKPVTVLGLTGVKAIASGDAHTCALLAAGTVKCWGANPTGQLGDGTLTDSARPVSVKGVGGSGVLSGVTAIAGGQWHTCALLKGSDIACWGQNNDGVLGDGVSNYEDALTPKMVVSALGTGELHGVLAISTNISDTCALVKGGHVECWGFNDYDELGPGDGPGPNGPGCEFGDFAQQCSPSPVRVKGISNATAVNANSCAVVKAGKITCWGTNGYRAVPGIAGAATLTSGGNDVSIPYDGDFACALLNAGTVECWGQNPYGELGDGTTKTSTAGVNVLGLKGVTAVSAGAGSACARLASGRVECWGADNYAQLGNGGGPNRSQPVAVTGL